MKIALNENHSHLENVNAYPDIFQLGPISLLYMSGLWTYRDLESIVPHD